MREMAGVRYGGGAVAGPVTPPDPAAAGPPDPAAAGPPDPAGRWWGRDGEFVGKRMGFYSSHDPLAGGSAYNLQLSPFGQGAGSAGQE